MPLRIDLIKVSLPPFEKNSLSKKQASYKPYHRGPKTYLRQPWEFKNLYCLKLKDLLDTIVKVIGLLII